MTKKKVLCAEMSSVPFKLFLNQFSGSTLLKECHLETERIADRNSNQDNFKVTITPKDPKNLEVYLLLLNNTDNPQWCFKETEHSTDTKEKNVVIKHRQLVATGLSGKMASKFASDFFACDFALHTTMTVRPERKACRAAKKNITFEIILETVVDHPRAEAGIFDYTVSLFEPNHVMSEWKSYFKVVENQ